jgi:bacteriocin-like protein
MENVKIIEDEELNEIVGGNSLFDYLFTPFITKKRSK